MNIFILDNDFQTNVESYVDKHVVKMITEHTQLLSSAVRLTGIDAGFRISHINHPCNIWVRKSLSNWEYLYKLNEYLHEEWRYRYNHSSYKYHKSYEIMKSLPKPNIKDIGLTDFVCSIDKTLIISNDPIENHRHYYIKKKQHLANWKKRNVPSWWRTIKENNT